MTAALPHLRLQAGGDGVNRRITEDAESCPDKRPMLTPQKARRGRLRGRRRRQICRHLKELLAIMQEAEARQEAAWEEFKRLVQELATPPKEGDHT